MAFGDSDDDAELRGAWHEFCDRPKAAGDLAFKDTSPANALQRADPFRYLTQNSGRPTISLWRPRTPAIR